MVDKSQNRNDEDCAPEDIFETTRTLIRIAPSTDDKNWKTFRAQFADEILVDFGDVRPPAVAKADDLVCWAQQAYSRMRTQHRVTNHGVRISGKMAKVISYGRAI